MLLSEIGKQQEGQKPKSVRILPPREAGVWAWSQLAELVLEAEIKDDVATRFRNAGLIQQAKIETGEGIVTLPEPVSDAMFALSIRVASDMEELHAVREAIPEEVWMEKKFERLVRTERVRNRLGMYEELAYLCAERLLEKVESGQIRDPETLQGLAIIAEKLTLQAQSQKHSGIGMQAGGVNVQINNINGNQPNGDLPGAGSVGTITMTLSSRIREQLSSPIIDPSDPSQRFLQRVEMLTAKDIPSLLREGFEEAQVEIVQEGE